MPLNYSKSIDCLLSVALALARDLLLSRGSTFYNDFYIYILILPSRVLFDTSFVMKPVCYASNVVITISLLDTATNNSAPDYTRFLKPINCVQIPDLLHGS
ncbi:hypothetical protein K0M31_010442 [Melipona bicolor]|uniref:Uncharacterized protein n=1 Tax=Melipona bicolor TaxID=60889 RepID=A0AA40KI23_9HYME|nr:hypothetical protein K0M31_010442 [Melipona bicolor]